MKEKERERERERERKELYLQCFLFGQLLFFMEPKWFVWLKCENKIKRKRRQGERE